MLFCKDFVPERESPRSGKVSGEENKDQQIMVVIGRIAPNLCE